MCLTTNRRNSRDKSVSYSRMGNFVTFSEVDYIKVHVLNDHADYIERCIALPCGRSIVAALRCKYDSHEAG